MAAGLLVGMFGKIVEVAAVEVVVGAIAEAVTVVIEEEKAVGVVVLGLELEKAVGLGVPLVIGGVGFPLGSG